MAVIAKRRSSCFYFRRLIVVAGMSPLSSTENRPLQRTCLPLQLHRCRDASRPKMNIQNIQRAKSPSHGK